MKITRRKHPDHLVDSCKRSSVNRMAAGSRLPRSSHGFFSPFSNFSNTPCVAKVFEQAVGPLDLQHLCCKALINKNKINILYNS